MENLLQNIASGLWIVLGVYCFFGLRKWNKRFGELYDELKDETEGCYVQLVCRKCGKQKQIFNSYENPIDIYTT